MKRLATSLNKLHYALFILGSIAIVGLSLLSQSTQETNKQLGLATPSPISTNKSRIEIMVPAHGDFSLAPPGILPGHPLYLGKMALQRLALIFTKNPIKRAQLVLHYSNLRMSAADKLIEQGNVDVAVSTATKGQAYLWQAIELSPSIPESEQTRWYDNLKLTALKHEEIIEKIRFVAEGQPKDQAIRLWEQLGDYRQTIANLSGSQFGYQRPEDLENNKITQSQPEEPIKKIPPIQDKPYL